MASSSVILDIRNLSVALPKGGDRPRAIADASLTVGKGEIVCVIGESGSGKSTLAQAVMGLLPPELSIVGGEISVTGMDLRRLDRSTLRLLRGSRMGMIFQEPMTALNPVMTVGAQIAEVLSIHTGLSRTERNCQVLDILRAVHLPEPERIFGAYPHQLSGGQRQRVMIAAALVLDPALLIADEPTTALDVTTQAQILRLIRDLQVRRGTGVLFVTHDFGVVAEIADHVVVMKAGQVVEQGPRDDVLRRPGHDYTRKLIASIPSLLPPPRRSKVGEIVLATAALTKEYSTESFFGKGRRVRALDNVEIVIHKGEALGVVGESGSGKSTLARCVARLVEPSSGRIRIGGLDMAAMPERQLRRHRKKVQIIFQDPYRSLNPRRTVEASIIEGPMNYGMAEAEARRRAEQLIALVGLPPQSLSRYPGQFSGGQRQRIAIARALAMEPDLLIADEAVSALDVTIQAQVLQLLDDIRRQLNLALLFITHDLRVAAQVCDAVVVMKGGKVVEQGQTRDVFATPGHPYTQALFESIPGRNLDMAEAG